MALLRSYNPWELESILRTSPRLALDAGVSFEAFSQDKPGVPAMFAYHGQAYQNLAPEDFTPGDLAFAGEHLYILSAFYGALRALDGIQPYRLELLSKLTVDGGNLYDFWGDKPARILFQAGHPVINLCSGEYTKLIAPYAGPNDRFISCRFLSWRRGKLTCLATGSKMARGQMARFIIKNRLTDPRDLLAFSQDDYRWEPALSRDGLYTFVQEL